MFWQMNMFLQMDFYMEAQDLKSPNAGLLRQKGRSPQAPAAIPGSFPLQGTGSGDWLWGMGRRGSLGPTLSGPQYWCPGGAVPKYAN